MLEPPPKMDTPPGPKDRFHITYLTLFILGLSHMLPISFLTTATNYWMYKFRNTSLPANSSSEHRTTLQANYNAGMMVCMQVPMVVFLFLTITFGHNFKVRARFLTALTSVLTIFIIITAFVFVDTDSWQVGFFALVMLLTSSATGMDAIFTITMFTAISRFPPHYLSAFVIGGSLSKCFNALLQIVSLTFNLSTTDSAAIYFSVGGFVLAVTLLAFFVVSSSNKFFLHYVNEKSEKEKRMSFKEAFVMLKKIWAPVLMLTISLFTMSCLPMALVVSEGEGQGDWNDLYFIPTATYLIPGVMEQLGQLLGLRFIPKLKGVYWVVITAIRMVVLIPLFFLCNAQPRHNFPVLLPHDYQYIIMQCVSSVSGGYIMMRYNYAIMESVDVKEIKDALHVGMLSSAVVSGAFSFVSIVSVNLL